MYENFDSGDLEIEKDSDCTDSEILDNNDEQLSEKNLNSRVNNNDLDIKEENFIIIVVEKDTISNNNENNISNILNNF